MRSPSKLGRSALALIVGGTMFLVLMGVLGAALAMGGAGAWESLDSDMRATLVATQAGGGFAAGFFGGYAAGMVANRLGAGRADLHGLALAAFWIALNVWGVLMSEERYLLAEWPVALPVGGLWFGGWAARAMRATLP